METVVRKVRDIDTADRRALEHVLGMQLRENQQVIIGVVNVESQRSSETAMSAEAELPEWCNVYAGLTDEEIDRLDQAIKQRLDLTRTTT